MIDVTRALWFFHTAPAEIKAGSEPLSRKIMRQFDCTVQEANALSVKLEKEGLVMTNDYNGHFWPDLTATGLRLLEIAGLETQLVVAVATTTPVPAEAPASQAQEPELPTNLELDDALVAFVTSCPDQSFLADNTDLFAGLAAKLGWTREIVAQTHFRVLVDCRLERIRDGADQIGLKAPGAFDPVFTPTEKSKPAEVNIVTPPTPHQDDAAVSPTQETHQCLSRILEMLDEAVFVARSRPQLDYRIATRLAYNPEIVHTAIDRMVFDGSAKLESGQTSLTLSRRHRSVRSDTEQSEEPDEPVFESFDHRETVVREDSPETVAEAEPPSAELAPAPEAASEAFALTNEAAGDNDPQEQNEESAMGRSRMELEPKQFEALAFVWSSQRMSAETERVLEAVELDYETFKKQVLPTLMSKSYMTRRGTELVVTRAGSNFAEDHLPQARIVIEAMEARGLFPKAGRSNGSIGSKPPPPPPPPPPQPPIALATSAMPPATGEPPSKPYRQIQILVFLDTQTEPVRSAQIIEATAIPRGSISAYLLMLQRAGLVVAEKAEGHSFLYSATTAVPPYLAERAEATAAAREAMGLVGMASATHPVASPPAAGQSEPVRSETTGNKMLDLLVLLDAQTGPVRQSEILPGSNFSVATLNYYVRRAVVAGWATSELVPGQVKNQQYRITAKGRARKQELEQPATAARQPSGPASAKATEPPQDLGDTSTAAARQALRLAFEEYDAVVAARLITVEAENAAMREELTQLRQKHQELVAGIEKLQSLGGA